MTSRFTYRLVCRAVQLSPKEGCADLLNFIASLWNLSASHLNLKANIYISCFVSLCILLFAVYVFNAEAVQETTEAVKSELLAEAV